MIMSNANMRTVFKQFGLLLISVAGLYAIVLAVTLMLVPRQEVTNGLDTAQAANTLYFTEPKYVFLARSALNTPSDKIIMLGASNVVVGFKQAQVQKMVPSAQVHNLGVGGSNMTQIREVIDLVQEVQSPQARQHNTFVIGIWYGLFADDAVRWNTPDRHAGDTDIDIERYRYGFFRRGASGPVEVLPARYLDTGTTLIHPYLVIDGWTRDMTSVLRQHLSGKTKVITDAQRNAVVLTEDEKQRYLDFWADYMGHRPLSEQQFAVLRDLVSTIVANGGHVILVDLPLPAWHAQRSSYSAQYQQHKQQLFAELAHEPNVRTVEMRSNESSDENFSDEVHPKPRVTQAWAQELVSALNAQHSNTQTLTQDTLQQSAKPVE
ncbi:MAG: hypothetical protein JWM03_858 [Rhodocyclales bacterium]|nr:hypothetical protein [Rhodocyclales bacterium]MDB5887986.1 hypothetical protein [Rhodocyclales bacterium]